MKTFHELSAEETALIAAINATAMQTKIQIHDLLAQLKQAKASQKKNQSQFDGIVAALGTTHGVANPIVSADMKRIISIGGATE